jgi:DNA-directed RNA polymerase specialized sigma24 family protein
MTDAPIRALLEQARLHLAQIIPNIVANRRLARQIERELRTDPQHAPRRTAIAVARALVVNVENVTVDPTENATRLHPDGIEVRAWYLVRRSDRPGSSVADPQWLAAAKAMPPIVREVLALSQVDGLDRAEIATRLGISPRAAKRHLRRAIAIVARFRDDAR